MERYNFYPHEHRKLPFWESNETYWAAFEGWNRPEVTIVALAELTMGMLRILEQRKKSCFGRIGRYNGAYRATSWSDKDIILWIDKAQREIILATWEIEYR